MASMLQTIKERLRKGLKVKTVTIDGIRVVSDTAFVTKEIRNALYKERYEDEELSLVAEAIGQGDRVLEIGAGIGLISMACAKRCGAENLLSYEANPSLEAVIRKNHALNGLYPELRTRAVSVQAGETKFYFNDNIFSSSLYDRDFGGEAVVQCDAFADVITAFNPTAMVIDVEGAEVDLIPAVDLGGVDKIIIELHPHIVGQDKIDALIAYFHAEGLETRGQIRRSYYFARG
ncbi:FkbM family methyltransferase [Breoghania corrubedonensis]|uniref:FkbM family methyltransferase n=1 Tax=Breoghania corrubedonensis TaxID=665038 RepID=A0A2T5V9I6_9HYPH|nr:FkbM family methyltransferase [Breoghania corrubedonensis]PTW60426.1 FkbM family methyltransferase [Breoghania corrubedonensis]